MEPPGTTSILPAFVSFYHYPRAFVTDPSVPTPPCHGFRGLDLTLQVP